MQSSRGLLTLLYCSNRNHIWFINTKDRGTLLFYGFMVGPDLAFFYHCKCCPSLPSLFAGTLSYFVSYSVYGRRCVDQPSYICILRETGLVTKGIGMVRLKRECPLAVEKLNKNTRRLSRISSSLSALAVRRKSSRDGLLPCAMYRRYGGWKVEFDDMIVS